MHHTLKPMELSYLVNETGSNLKMPALEIKMNSE